MKLIGSFRTRWRFTSWGIAALATAGALVGCNSGSQTSNGTAIGRNNAAPGDPTTAQIPPGDVAELTVGYNPTIVQPQPLIGLMEGQYAQELPGVSVNGRPYDAGPAVLEALRAGVVQIACSGPFPAIKAYAKEGDVVLLCGAASGGTQLMVAKDGPIKSLKDLKGKIIGVNQPGSTVEAMVRYNLLKAGLKPDDDVRLVEVKPAEQAEALKSGQVQAVASPAPWPSDVQINGNGRPLLDWKQIYENGNYLSGSIYTTKKFAEEHPEFIAKFVAANRRITDELNKDRIKGDARVLDAWSKQTGKTLDPKVAKAAFATIKYTTEANEAGLQKFADINFELGLLRNKADLKGFVFQSKPATAKPKQ
ncbi:MAG: sulfonate transport system substrate-binding protein [Abditibacteriota bacterium]|nr:sulfonate transport system substrate-binding protein [Abditibacteriota bacterium]